MNINEIMDFCNSIEYDKFYTIKLKHRDIPIIITHSYMNIGLLFTKFRYSKDTHVKDTYPLSAYLPQFNTFEWVRDSTIYEIDTVLSIFPNLNKNTETNDMKTIENLLAEYKIRFRDTERIKEEGYPFRRTLVSELNTGRYFSEVSVGGGVIKIDNKNGIVCGKYRDTPIVWATADLKEKPDKWVVEKDIDHPAWRIFKDWYDKTYDHKHLYNLNFYGANATHRDSIQEFRGFQYLTLDQWAEFFLPKVDFSILNDEDWFYAVDVLDVPVLVNGVLDVADKLKPHFTYFINTGELIKGNRWGIKKDSIKTLCTTTPEDLTPLFERYPELDMEVRVGDSAIIYDNLNRTKEAAKQGVVLIEKVRHHCKGDRYEGFERDGKHAYKIHLNQPLQPQIDNFLKLKE